MPPPHCTHLGSPEALGHRAIFILLSTTRPGTADGYDQIWVLVLDCCSAYTAMYFIFFGACYTCDLATRAKLPESVAHRTSGLMRAGLGSLSFDT